MRNGMLLLAGALCHLLIRLLHAAENTNSVIVPVKFNHGRVVIPARANDAKELTFLLDTGCTIMTLQPEIMDALKLEQAGSVRINGIAGEEHAPTYKGFILDLGGANYSPWRVACVPSERNGHRRTDGVVGSGFLRRFVVEIDPKEKLIRLYSPTNFTYTGKGAVVPFHFREEIPVLKAALVLPDKRSLEGEFELDTGCDSGLCLGETFVKQNKLLDGAKVESSEKFGIGGSVETRSGTVPALKLGQMEIKEPQTDFFMAGSPVDAPLAGHIGMGVLHRYKVILDYAHKQLIVEE